MSGNMDCGKASATRDTFDLPAIEEQERFPRLVAVSALALAAGFGLFVVSRHNYPLFHSLIELASIAVAWSVFLLVWNARRFIANDALVLLGIAYLFVGLLDLVHTVAYKGMAVFPERHSANAATQLWIAARSLESASLLAFSVLLARPLQRHVVFLGYSVVTGLFLATIVYTETFPVCYVEGKGLTTFKVLSEYAICLTLVGAAVVLYRRRALLAPRVLRLLLASTIMTIGAELTFTGYQDVYGLTNLIGHYLKVISFLLLYLALIHSGLTEPYSLLFRELAQQQTALRESERSLRSSERLLDSIRRARHSLSKLAIPIGRLSDFSTCWSKPPIASSAFSTKSVVTRTAISTKSVWHSPT